MNSKQKGSRGEREFASFCREQGYEARRGQQYCGANGDADVVGLPGIHIEVKRTERLSLYDALAQAEHDKKTEGLAIVVHRKNHCKWVVIMDAEDWFTLYREWETHFKG
jgi:Holliday junction resolvase